MSEFHSAWRMVILRLLKLPIYVCLLLKQGSWGARSLRGTQEHSFVGYVLQIFTAAVAT